MNPKDIIISGAKELGVNVSDEQAEALSVYADELARWNRKVNLTAITRRDEIAVKHFLDSLSLLPMLPDGPARAADIGSGAGFPGMVVALMRPDIEVDLIEPSRKKATFLRHIKRTLGLENVSVLEQKAEDAETPPGGCDVIFSRAFTEPGRLLIYAGAMLAPNGRVVLSLGPGWDGALPEGWAVSGRRDIRLPHSGHTRSLLDIRRAPAE